MIWSGSLLGLDPLGLWSWTHAEDWYSEQILSTLWIALDFEWDSLSLVLALTFTLSLGLGLANCCLGYLQGWSNEQRNGIKWEERMIEFGTANRQNNVPLDDEISPEGIMTMS